MEKKEIALFIDQHFSKKNTRIIKYKIKHGGNRIVKAKI